MSSALLTQGGGDGVVLHSHNVDVEFCNLTIKQQHVLHTYSLYLDVMLLSRFINWYKDKLESSQPSVSPDSVIEMNQPLFALGNELCVCFLPALISFQYLHPIQMWHNRRFDDTICFFSPTMLYWPTIRRDPLPAAVTQLNNDADYVRETTSSGC